jgi:hypothetical protein
MIGMRGEYNRKCEVRMISEIEGSMIGMWGVAEPRPQIPRFWEELFECGEMGIEPIHALKFPAFKRGFLNAAR